MLKKPVLRLAEGSASRVPALCCAHLKPHTLNPPKRLRPCWTCLLEPSVISRWETVKGCSRASLAKKNGVSTAF